MQMTFRWYGDGNDSITPEMIKQIPGVTGLVWALHDKQAGEVWEPEEIEGILADSRVKAVRGTILTGEMRAHNTFEAPEEVHTEEFAGVTAAEDRISFTIPPRSVLHLEAELM